MGGRARHGSAPSPPFPSQPPLLSPSIPSPLAPPSPISYVYTMLPQRHPTRAPPPHRPPRPSSCANPPPTPPLPPPPPTKTPRPRTVAASSSAAACRSLITTTDMRTRVHGKHEHVFANPAGYMYQIGCFATAPGCSHEGPPSWEFTWFQGHTWQIAVCRGCNALMGWRFRTPLARASRPDPDPSRRGRRRLTPKGHPATETHHARPQDPAPGRPGPHAKRRRAPARLLRDEGRTIEPWVRRLLAETIPLAATRIDTLSEALSFYADMNLWQRAWVGGGFADSLADEDGGDIARCALRGQCDRLWPGEVTIPVEGLAP